MVAVTCKDTLLSVLGLSVFALDACAQKTVFVVSIVDEMVMLSVYVPSSVKLNFQRSFVSPLSAITVFPLVS
jgi:hypothetical protein